MSTKPVCGTAVARWLRRFLAVVLVWNLGMGTYDLARGYLFGLVSFACVLGLAATMTYQTRVIHRIERANRPRPDYSAIARMEREVYGGTFEHDGAGRSFPVESEADVARALARVERKRPVRYVKPPRPTFEDDRRAMRELGEKRRAALVRHWVAPESDCPMCGVSSGSGNTYCKCCDEQEHPSNLRWERPS